MRQLIRGLQHGPGGQGGRDLRADAFRGLALWFILIDHIPGNRLGGLTLRNIALCDATEAFVLLAGYAAGIAYGAALDRRGWTFAAAVLIRRVSTLYVAHIFLFVVFTAQVGYSAAALESSAYLDELHLDVFGEQPYLALLQALLLRFQPAFLDILPLYIVLLLLLVPALALLRRPAVLMAVSALLYFVVRLLNLNLPNWTGGGWFFNPLAWQVLFFTGCLLGYARPRGGRRGPVPAVPFHPLLATAAGVALLIGMAIVFVNDYGEAWLAEAPPRLAELLTTIDKTGLHPFRLISILAMAYLVGHAVPRDAGWLRSRAASPFVLMGQHGLPVFCAGIFLAFLGRLALEMDDRWPMQLLVNLAGLGALVLVGVIGAWYRLRERGEAPRHAPASAADPLRPPVPSTTTMS
ncbi:OpgC domain-containing protein [Belnapia sp. T6]|uniref:OpgC domain-containing protein n=1 Tax=Belnapia mucosa TaxID=2804532 RepID=A0ABS1V5X5_9PROT|nr:OpgC domain-containing protein [Belnapia mucosa]MBL6455693.1 OpgC domain-containing protein [Belnapia mucosa]